MHRMSEATVAKIQQQTIRSFLAGVIDTLEAGYHPQNPSPDHPADFLRKRYPHLLDDDDAVASGREQA